MPRYSGGAIVLEDTSPWTQFLEGVSQGATRAIKRGEEQADKAKAQAQAIKEGLMNGSIKPEQLGTQEGQAFLKSLKLDKDQDIKAIVDRGMATLPKELTQGPGTPVSIPSAANPELGGYAAEIPGQQLTPSAKQVNDLLEAEATKKKLAIDEAQSKIQLFRQMEVQRNAENIRLARRQSLPDQFKQKKADLDALGIPQSARSYHVDENNYVTVTIDPAKLLTATDKEARAYTQFEDKAASYQEKQTSHVYRLRSMLENDKILPQNLDLGNDEESKWYLAALQAIGQKKDPKEKVAATVAQVERIVELINRNIQSYNRAIQAAGDQAKADQQTITSRFIPKVSFEDVSGGLSAEEYKKRKNPPDAKDLISEVRDDYRRTGIMSPRASDTKATRDSDKVKKVYDELKNTVLAAASDNPGLSAAKIRQVLMTNKEQLKAEYGLDERLFSLLSSMADRVLG